MIDTWYSLPVPSHASPSQRIHFLSAAAELARSSAPVPRASMHDTAMDAGLSVLTDLAAQGWRVRVDAEGLFVQAPTAEAEPADEKERVRGQELLKRDEQLATPSVRRFIERMERPREYKGAFVSIFSLMRDGGELADALVSKGASPEVIDPYVEVISSRDRCGHTGLRLLDIWRYFRHTWSNQLTSTPGRTIPLLIRDRAAPFHPVIGIAALGSAIVQIAERDDWIGWQPQDVVSLLDENPELRWARWLYRRLEHSLDEIYLDDLIEDGLYWPNLWDEPTDHSVERLRSESAARRQDHNRFARKSDFETPSDPSDVDAWTDRARSDLFRSKRCLALADLLSARKALAPYLAPKPTRAGLRSALEDNKARRAISAILRRAKAEAVGTEIADLTVCGAVPPYNALIGGKLVGMLAVSPTVVHDYHQKYSEYASQIASSLAGKPVRRRSNLVFVGTTSLYGSSSSQYNRLRLPRHVLDSREDIVFRRLGRSRSFGTSHLSAGSVKALVKLAEETQTGARVNSIFGEGVNPKFRKMRQGLDILGWPSEELLQHRRPRLVYGVALIDNLLPYLLGAEEEPRYLFRRNVANDTERIAAWWRERWLLNRIQSEEVLATVRQHRVDRPVRHGARVALPPVPADAHDSA
jgi:Druantia protein DruA